MTYESGSLIAVGDCLNVSNHLPVEPAHANHIVQFYEDERFLYDVVARFLGAGLATGQPAVVIATHAHWKQLSQRLNANAFDVERACNSGLLAFLDAHQTLSQFMVAGMPDWERFNAVVGSAIDKSSGSRAGLVRAYGEMVDVLWRRGNQPAAIRLEEMWNDLAKTHSFSLLCTYVLGNFYKAADAEQFRRVCALHTHVVPTESYARIEEPDAQLRQISVLQQRARALESEIEHCRELETVLRSALKDRARAERERDELFKLEQQARREAEAAGRAKDEFLAMLGHELRNPLSPIVTSLQLMKLRGDVKSSKEQNVIERQVQHLVRLVDDLLDISRITRGKVQLNHERVELSSVVAKAVEIASPLLEQRGHHFDVSVPRNGMWILADAVRMAQVIANLLTNAAKYTEPGGHISLRAWRDGHEIVIRVKDSGIGISADLLPRVFDIFTQGHQASDRGQGGLGIGLAIVRNLVSMHGGTVVALSEGTGKGSEFVIRLPGLPKADASEQPLHGESAAHSMTSTNPCRILVVDDNEDAAELLGDMLEAVGHQVALAHDGPRALDVIDRFIPDIAVLDIGLPVMDGYELAKRIRERLGSSTRLMAVTGYGQEHDRQRSTEAGFESHFVKPLDTEKLLHAIDSAATG